MSAPILLDTCALLWLSNGAPLHPAATAAIEAARDDEDGLLVSPISAWEIGQLVGKGRLPLLLEPRLWFAEALEAGLTLAPMPPEVLIASSFLPGERLRDPADRILAATARTYRYRLMTRDRPLLAFGAEGNAEMIEC
ncbi:MAG: type II toxin-antitoxin system VapC family toxin [Caulobacterales bacterium]